MTDRARCSLCGSASCTEFNKCKDILDDLTNLAVKAAAKQERIYKLYQMGMGQMALSDREPRHIIKAVAVMIVNALEDEKMSNPKFQLDDRVKRVKSIQRQGPRERGTVRGMKYERNKLMIFVLWDGHNTHTWVQDDGIEHIDD